MLKKPSLLLSEFLEELRRRRRSVVLSVVTMVFVFFSFILYKAWNQQLSNRVTCDAAYSDISHPKDMGYLEFDLLEQHPIEPTIKGEVFVRIHNADPRPSDYVEVQLSAAGNYATHVHRFPRQYNAASKTFDIVGGNREMSLVTTDSSHWYFPLDSATIDQSATVTPDSNIQWVRIVNRVPGFVVDCASLSSTRTAPGTHHIRFKLQRSPLVQVTAITLVLSALVFLILILWFGKKDNLATSTASFFFTLWSIRAILASQVKTFPTLLDCAILTLCVLMLVGSILKITLTGPNTT